METHAKLYPAPTHRWLISGALGMSAFFKSDAHGEDWPVHGYYYLIQNMSIERPEQALEQFSDKAIFIDDVNCKQQTPCIGKEAIRNYYIKALLSNRIGLPLFEQRFDGRRLVAKSEISREAPSKKCVTKVIGIHSFEFQGRQISALHYHVDSTYPGSAGFLSSPFCKKASSLTNRF